MTEPPGVPGRGLGRLEFEPSTIGFSAGARISTVALTLVMDWCGYWLVATVLRKATISAVTSLCLPMVASTGFGSQDSLFEVSFEGLAFAAHKVWPPRLKATVAFPANR